MALGCRRDLRDTVVIARTRTADWVLDLGPEGGVKGGEIVAEGTPEQVAKEPRSFTGRYLAPLLERGKVRGERVAAE